MPVCRPGASMHRSQSRCAFSILENQPLAIAGPAPGFRFLVSDLWFAVDSDTSKMLAAAGVSLPGTCLGLGRLLLAARTEGQVQRGQLTTAHWPLATWLRLMGNPCAPASPSLNLIKLKPVLADGRHLLIHC
jgi:hypothetical protein